LVDLVKLHKLDPRINPRIGNAKSTINRVNSEGLFDSDSSDAKSENGLPRRIGGKKNHGSVEAGAKDYLSILIPIRNSMMMLIMMMMTTPPMMVMMMMMMTIPMMRLILLRALSAFPIREMTM
jgi:hypothetical protein